MSKPREAVNALINAGWSEARIAQELRELLRENDPDASVAQSTIHRIKVGEQSARFDIGLGLIRLCERLDSGAPTQESATN